MRPSRFPSTLLRPIARNTSRSSHHRRPRLNPGKRPLLVSSGADSHRHATAFPATAGVDVFCGVNLAFDTVALVPLLAVSSLPTCNSIESDVFRAVSPRSAVRSDRNIVPGTASAPVRHRPWVHAWDSVAWFGGQIIHRNHTYPIAFSTAAVAGPTSPRSRLPVSS